MSTKSEVRVKAKVVRMSSGAALRRILAPEVEEKLIQFDDEMSPRAKKNCTVTGIQAVLS